MSAATDTIAKMVVGLGADTTEMKRGFAEGAREVQKFAGNVQVTAKRMQELLQQTGGDLTKAAQLAAAEAQKQLNGIIPIASRAGFQAGQTLARTMSQGFAQGNAIGNIRRVLSGTGGIGAMLGGASAGLGSRGRHALIAGAFTLAGLGDAFAQGETKLTRFTQGLNQLLRSASVVAAFFGPTGLLVSAVLAGTSFVLDFFARTRDEAAKMAKAIEDRIRALINTRDTAQQMARIQELEIGEAAEGSSTNVRGAFRGGILDLQNQVRVQEAALARANAAQAIMLRKSLDDLKRRLAPMLAERAQLTAAILNPTTVPEIRGLPGVTTTAPAAGHEFDEMQRVTEKVLRLYRALHEEGSPAISEARRLVALYFQLGEAADELALKNPWDDQVTSIRQLRVELEKTIPLLKGIGGAIPGVGLTPTGGPKPFPTPKIVPPAIDATPKFDILTRTLGVTLSNMVRSIGNTVGGVLSTALTAAVGPVALLFRALEPALNLLYPLLDKLVAPIAAVLQVIVVGLEPALRLLFPIIKAIAIVLSFFGEMAARVTAILARALGNLVIAIGHVVKTLSFGLAGRGIIRAGESILRFADQTKQNADEMLAVRKRIERMQFGDTADAITGLGDAAKRATDQLLNVPFGFKIALERFLATEAVAPPAGYQPPITGIPTGTGGTGSGGANVTIMGNLVVQSYAKDAEALFDDVSAVARGRAQRRWGTSMRAADTLAG